MAELRQQLNALQQHVGLLVDQARPPQPTNTQALAASDWMCSPQSDLGMQIPSLPSAQHLPVSQSLQSPRDIRPKSSTPSHASATRAESLPATDITSAALSHHSHASTNPISGSGRLAIACHPLLSFSHTEAMRLVDVYEDECGSVYPLIDIGHLRDFTTQFYDSVTMSTKPATWRTFKLDQASKRDFNTLEIVLAIALVIEGHGSTHLSSALMDELEGEIDHRPSGVCPDTHFAAILTLMVGSLSFRSPPTSSLIREKSFYQFYRDEEVLAWRTIGLAARIAVELGLHLNDPPFATFRSTRERELANRLFWCIYCLDRRWSFGTGLPFGIQEEDIDPSLLEPVSGTVPIISHVLLANSRGRSIHTHTFSQV